MNRADYEERREAVFAPLLGEGWEQSEAHPPLLTLPGTSLDVYASMSGAFDVRLDFRIVASLGAEVPPVGVTGLLRAMAEQVVQRAAVGASTLADACRGALTEGGES